MRQALEMAREVQLSTLPATMPALPGYDVCGTSRPAELTGGDTFDLAMLEQGLLVVLADATGHGIAPALSVTQMHAMLRIAFGLGVDLDAAFVQVNNRLAEDAAAGSLHHRLHRAARSRDASPALPQRRPGADPALPGRDPGLRHVHADKLPAGRDAAPARPSGRDARRSIPATSCAALRRVLRVRKREWRGSSARRGSAKSSSAHRDAPMRELVAVLDARGRHVCRGRAHRTRRHDRGARKARQVRGGIHRDRSPAPSRRCPRSSSSRRASSPARGSTRGCSRPSIWPWRSSSRTW